MIDQTKDRLDDDELSGSWAAEWPTDHHEVRLIFHEPREGRLLFDVVRKARELLNDVPRLNVVRCSSYTKCNHHVIIFHLTAEEG